jgi:Tfp pilus assembly protein PilF
MNIPPARLSIAWRAGAAGLGVILVLGLGACGSSDKPGASGTTGTGDAKSTAALLQKALQEQVTGNLEQAEADFLEVIRRDPKNKFAYYDLGLIYQTQNKNADAESQYRLALTIDSKFGPALYNLAILRTAANDADGAIDLYRQAIAANAKDASSHFNLGLLLRDAGKTAEANNEVKAAVTLDPSFQARATREGYPFTGK